MNELSNNLARVQNSRLVEKTVIVAEMTENVEAAGYTIVELNDKKPWGPISV